MGFGANMSTFENDQSIRVRESTPSIRPRRNGRAEAWFLGLPPANSVTPRQHRSADIERESESERESVCEKERKCVKETASSELRNSTPASICEKRGNE